MSLAHASVRPVPPCGPKPARLWAVPSAWTLPHPVLPFAAEPEPAALPEETAVPPAHRQAALALTSAIVEVLTGRRPPQQLDRWVTSDVQGVLHRLAAKRADPTLRLRSVRIQSPAEHALEVAVHLSAAQRSQAAGLRLEKRTGRWVCTSFEAALHPGAVARAG